jgi:pyruvate dehydrogenase E2 component (dihydrolipoamide acetyltransferase)
VIQQFRLPDLGEGLTEGDILKWTVAVGDTVEVNDTIAEVETVKAAVELPSPYAGVVAALHAAEGETVPVGTPIISIETGAPDDQQPGPAGAGPQGAADLGARAADDPAGVDRAAAVDMVPSLPGEGGAASGEEKQLTLVGYGPREESGGRRRRRSPAAGGAGLAAATTAGAQTSFNLPPATAARQAAVDPGVSVESDESDGPVLDAPPAAATTAPTARPPAKPLAKPPVRKLAKALGVDLATVTPTGPNGSVSREDVASAHQWSVTPANGQLQATTDGEGDHPTDGRGRHAHSPLLERETRIPIKGVRKHTAAAMVASAFTAPHVTEFVTIDMTATMDFRDRVAARREFREVKVSPLLFVAKAVLLAARTTPEVNARWDEAAQEIVLAHYVNLGIAAATPRGLIVPNIKDADRLPLLDLARAMTDLTQTARTGRTSPADMSGGTFTITNVGIFGVDTGTPILNPGESAILAFGAVRRQPWVVGSGADERIEPRWVTQLALSFDHRVVDGEQGSRFLAEVGTILTDPATALLSAG